MKVLMVGGTWGNGPDGDAGEWFAEPGTGFVAFLRAAGHEPLLLDGRGFEWSGDLNGHLGWLRWLGLGWLPAVRRQGSDWRAGGAALFYYWRALLASGLLAEDECWVLICHSHGLQVALEAAARGVRIPRLLSVGGPIRQDMRATAMRAHRNIEAWLQVSGGCSDNVQIAGGIGDGAVGVVRRPFFPESEYDEVPGIEHSKVLRERPAFELWVLRGWFYWFQFGRLPRLAPA